ncbi:MAG: type I glyceraldehyde-3-phosphate dehydrogenase [Parcubacteria group bacterium]|nr:type I glyceraldehyde-3-phosphate dehydrogenase [Parcubacteria group bacterium]
MAHIIKVAINGFGRIGRAAFKIALTKPELKVVAINDLTTPEVLTHLLRYDTNYGRYDREVRFDEKHLIIGGSAIPVYAEKEPQKLPWRELSVDVVLECTGRFTRDGAARAHLEAGAKRVIVSAPTKGGDVNTYLLGVNSDVYKGEDVISNASCTTNCIAPVAHVIQNAFGIVKAAMTTIHGYTAEQNLVDGPPPALHHDLRRARAAAENIVPTTTGAAISTTEAIPELKGKFDGLAMRVPVPVGSLSDFTMLVSRPATVEEVNQAFKDAAIHPFYKGILEVTEDPIVSSDIVGTTASAIVDLTLTKVIDGDLLKVIAWYDNEWGYANRLVEEALLIAKS